MLSTKQLDPICLYLPYIVEKNILKFQHNLVCVYLKMRDNKTFVSPSHMRIRQRFSGCRNRYRRKDTQKNTQKKSNFSSSFHYTPVHISASVCCLYLYCCFATMTTTTVYTYGHSDSSNKEAKNYVFRRDEMT